MNLNWLILLFPVSLMDTNMKMFDTNLNTGLPTTDDERAFIRPSFKKHINTYFLGL